MNIIGSGAITPGRVSTLSFSPSYVKVGKGFQGRGNICRVFGQPLGSPYDCLNDIWDNTHEPSIWNATRTFDCKNIELSNTCCEIVGIMWKWYNLSTGLQLEICLEKDGVEVELMEYDIPDPPSGSYYVWYFVAAWVGRWVDSTNSEIYDNGQYYWILKEKNNKFTPLASVFNVINLPVPPKAIITDIQYPSEVDVNTPFDIIYEVYNDGSTGMLYGKIYDMNTNSVIPGSDWTADVSCGKHISKVYQFNGITQPLYLKIEVGHVE